MLRKRIIVVWLPLAILLVILTLLRLGFCVANFNLFRETTSSDFTAAFALGLRFDLSIVLMTALPYLILTLLPDPRLPTQKSAKDLLILLALLAASFLTITTNTADIGYYPISGSRISIMILHIFRDVSEQASQLARHYWPLATAIIVLPFIPVLAAAFLLRAPQPPRAKGWLSFAVKSVLLLVFLVIAIRGGFQEKPLSPAHAGVMPTAALSDLARNSAFSVAHEAGGSTLQPVEYFATAADARRAAVLSPAVPEDRPPMFDNVVILILESFASEYSSVGNPYPGYMPFVDSLARRGLTFQSSFANGRRSIDAVSSIFLGLPALMGEPFVTSIYQNIKVHGLGEILGRHGYRSAFFHGGRNGTMFFDVLARIAGFNAYRGLNEYPSKGDFDGHWGVFDEPYLQYCVKELSSFREPFLASIFTLSSHEPYAIPTPYSGRFPKGTLANHESIGYADFAVKRFFEDAASKPWFAHTLFIITADHTSLNDVPSYATEPGTYRVPIIFYHGGGRIPSEVMPKAAQHADILPSIIHYLGIRGEKLPPFGHSLFDRRYPGRVVNRSAGAYWLLGPDSYLRLLPDGTIGAYAFDGKTRGTLALSDQGAPDQKRQDELRGLIQLFTNGLVNNELFK